MIIKIFFNQQVKTVLEDVRRACFLYEPILIILVQFRLSLFFEQKLFYTSYSVLSVRKEYWLIINSKKVQMKITLFIPTILFLALMATLTQADFIQEVNSRVLSQLCCSQCPEMRVPASPLYHTKYQNMVLNCLSQQCSLPTFLTNLRRFPPQFTQSLFDQLRDLDLRSNYSYFSRGGVDPTGFSYSSIDQGTLNFLTNSTIGVIQANLSNRSYNSIKTEVGFLQDFLQSYNDMVLLAAQSGVLTDGSSISTNSLYYFGMTFIMGYINTLTNQQQQAILSCVDLMNSRPSYVSNSNSFNFPWKLPMQQEYLGATPQIVDKTSINSSDKYFLKNVGFPKSYCPIQAYIDNSSSNPGRRLTENSTETIQLTTFNIWFERRTEDEPSIFSQVYYDMLSQLNFYGVILTSDNDNSTTTKGGFEINEDAMQVWTRIDNKVFGSFVYYAIPGVKNGVQGACPLNCISSC